MNDREWIHTRLERFEGPLILYARRITGDVDRARDAVQETFLELCAAPRAEVEPHVAQWLFTVCRNKSLDIRRKEEVMNVSHEVPAIERASTDHDPSTALQQGEEKSRVLAMLASLPDNQQEVLRLKFQSGLSYKEISRVTGHSVSNVGFLIHVGLRALREKLAVRQVGEMQGRMS